MAPDNTRAVERKWRQRWQEARVYEVDLDQPARPYYNLMEFPYPSGEGLHVGHVYTYCGADTLGRLRRMQGFDVFQPMGYDAFGIHSENYALKEGRHPAELIPANIARFREQLDRLGCAFDWSHQVNTSTPEYYRWTQWLFLQLFRTGLAYRAEAPVNWCPQDKTVLANEQVKDGKCERCDAPIEQRTMLQWFFRITAYADRLLEYRHVDFAEEARNRQREWIGRREGAEVVFPVAGSDEAIRVFTTRPDTLFGATFLVLAPEHPLALALTPPDRQEAVRGYLAGVGRKLEKERLTAPTSTGVFTGAYALHPITGERLPIWVADYVLARYGTGAIMAVPAHDERDFAFATSYGLPVRPVVVPADGDDPEIPYAEAGVLADSGEFTGQESAEAGRAIVSRLEARHLGRPCITYRLRDWLISRQRYWGPPIPVVHCERCGIVPVPEAHLPVLLPQTENFRPTGTGQSPLAALPEFVRTPCPACGTEARRETDVCDNFLDSAWYYLRYLSPENEAAPWDPARVRTWLPVDHYAGGPEHATMHHLYARFLVKALHDLDHLPCDEPFARLRLHGTITKDGSKMSKSRGNVVSPDRYLDQYGTDVFRMYMLFLGPWEHGGDFSDTGISGIQRFLQKAWSLLTEPQPGGEPDPETADTTERRRHQLIARVTEGIETLRFHLATAALMEEIGRLRECRPALTEEQWSRSADTFVRLLAPLAPHFAEELWERRGGAFSIHRQPWPVHDAGMLAEETLELPVQINGRVRGHVVAPADADREAITRRVLAAGWVREALAGREPKRIVVVPGRMMNIVV